MKGMVIRMNARKNGKNVGQKPRRVWGMTLRTGLLGIMAVSVLCLGVACTRNNMEDGTVADSNVGSVTSDASTEKHTDKVTDRVTEKVTEAKTTTTEPGSSVVTTPGTTPGTMPGTDADTSKVTEHQTSATTTVPGTGTGTPGTAAKSRGGKG